MIRSATPADAPKICEIYNPFVEGTTITFEEKPLPAAAMAERIAAIGSLPWLILELEGDVAGYAYATPWRVRSAYRFSVETTVYLNPHFHGRGHGATLYRALIDGLKELRIHRAIGGIALPNQASVALHEKLGFKKVAHFSEVGWKFERWIDVGYWELPISV